MLKKNVDNARVRLPATTAIVRTLAHRPRQCLTTLSARS